MTDVRDTTATAVNGGPAPGTDDGADAVRATHRLATERAQDIARRVHKVPSPARSGPAYVGLITRAVAFVVDAAIINTVAAVVAAAAALVVSIFPVSSGVHTAIVAIGGVLFFLWVSAYFVTFWATTGQTPGNRLMRIRVVRPRGEPVKGARALLRLAGLLAAALPLFAGFIPIVLTDRRRGLADWLADTVVVQVPDQVPGAR